MARDFAKSFYDSSEWRDVRAYVLMRDAYLCRHCGAPATEVHHIIHLSPANIYDPAIALNPDNLVSLCKECHFAQHRGEHGRGRIWEEQYEYCFDENGFLQKK
jgi:5-methylcytosine-specific restriction endonuclease McrA